MCFINKLSPPINHIDIGNVFLMNSTFLSRINVFCFAE